MSKFLTLVAIGLTVSFGATQAQVQKMTPLQDKTAMCDKAAGDKRGDERRAFIRICLAAKSEPQQNKVAHCEHGNAAEDL